jgi:hypothetical protein
VQPPCKLYLTYRSEYLVLQDLCVGVRDRSSGTWLPLHSAVSAQVLGPLAEPFADTPTTAMPTTRVRLGERLCLYAVARRVTTGQIVAIEEPSMSLLEDADRHWRALFSPSDPRHSAIVLAR